jgi:LysM repeat protein
VTVIESLYVTVAEVNSTDANTQLLKRMRDSLSKVTNNADTAEALQVENEITSWLDGRDKYHAGNYQEALTNYDDAINLNPSNPATIYERARVYMALKQYDNALLDLNNTIKIVQAKQPTTQEENPSVTAAITTTVPATDTLTQAPPATQDLSVIATAIPPSIQPSVPAVVLSPQKNKFESTFSTYIEIVNAVKSLIGNDPVLQDTIQGSSENTYTSLKPYFSTSTPTLTVPPGRPTFTSLHATDTSAPVQQVSSSATSTPEFVQYVVQIGDSLISIATRFGVDVNMLAQINNLSDANLLFVGQTLKIPASSTALTALVATPLPATFIPATSIFVTPSVITAIKPTQDNSQPTAILFPPTASNVPPTLSFGGTALSAEINMGFSPISIPSGGTSQLRITIFNPNAFQLTSVAWNDNLPSDIWIFQFVSNTCGGVVTAPTGATAISLDVGTVAAQTGSTPGSCTVSVNVTSTTLGTFTNAIPAGTFSAAGGGTNITNTTPASATLRVSP